MLDDKNHYFMQHAFHLAKVAAQHHEVPVGALVVFNDTIIGEGHNKPILTSDPTAHAEIVALRNAAEKIANYRLVNTTLYVTLEPCLMCVGAIIHARVAHVVFGAYDKKAGAVTSCHQGFAHSFLNHRVTHQGGLLAEECGSLLSAFFKERR